MNNIFFVSDTHFNHSNILTFFNADGSKTRHFTSVQEMNETMIENWNAVVSEQDIIYHLGDVYFGSPVSADVILSRLNGKKRLILGNHDIIEKKHTAVYTKHFQKIMVWRMFTEHGILASHVPLHRDSFKYKNLINVHGHVHGNSLNEDGYVNVCVEKTNYTPVHIDELRIR